MHEDLLAQAKLLATIDPRRPSQVNLRRAVSATYYAVFHCLTEGACRTIMGAKHDAAGYRNVLARSFTHKGINDACRSFSGGTLPDFVRQGLPSTATIPKEVQTIAKAFVRLQEQRHHADYDRAASFTRSEVLMLIEGTIGTLSNFENLESSLDKQFFLACLLAWPTLSKR